MDLKTVQAPLKDGYREDPGAAQIQVTCQMVAAAMGIETERIEVVVEGDLDLRGTLGVDRDAPVGFSAIRLRYEIDASPRRRVVHGGAKGAEAIGRWECA